MSKSLNINAPQIVQTRNTLNAVPSGSTAEPDYTVKFVPQTLTDAQKAQARQNIGAAAEGGGGTQVQSDWNQTDNTQPDYIKNKPTFPTEPVNEYKSTVFSIISNVDTDIILFDTAYNVKVTNSAGTTVYSGDYTVGEIHIPILKGKNLVDFVSQNSEGWDIDNKNGRYIVKANYGVTPMRTYNLFTTDSKFMTYGEGDFNSTFRNITAPGGYWISLDNKTPYGFWATEGALFGSETPIDVVLVDKSMSSINTGGADEHPPVTTGKVYVPRNRYTEFVTKIRTFWLVTSEVDTFLANRVVIYDMINWINEEPILYTFNSVPLTMTDANGAVIDGDFVAQNVTITPAV